MATVPEGIEGRDHHPLRPAISHSAAPAFCGGQHWLPAEAAQRLARETATGCIGAARLTPPSAAAAIRQPGPTALRIRHHRLRRCSLEPRDIALKPLWAA